MKLIGQMYFGRQRILSALKNSTAQWEWTPARLLYAGGYWAGGYAPADARLYRSSNETEVATTVGDPVGRAVGVGSSLVPSQSTALSKPTVARWPATGLRNLAHGSAAVEVNDYWYNSITTAGGVTATKVGHGIEDGIPYVDYRYVGTPTTGSASGAYATARSSIPAKAGDYFNARMEYRMIAGSTVGVSGVRAETIMTNDTGAYLGQTPGTGLAPTESYQLSQSGGMLSVDSTTAARVAVALYVNIGTAVDITIRYRGLQFERGLQPTAFQLNYSPTNVIEVGQESHWHVYNDGGDSLPVTMAAGKVGAISLNADGAILHETITLKSSGQVNTLRQRNQTDVALRPAAFTADDAHKVITSWKSKGYKVDWTPAMLFDDTNGGFWLSADKPSSVFNSIAPHTFAGAAVSPIAYGDAVTLVEPLSRAGEGDWIELTLQPPSSNVWTLNADGSYTRAAGNSNWSSFKPNVTGYYEYSEVTFEIVSRTSGDMRAYRRVEGSENGSVIRDGMIAPGIYRIRSANAKYSGPDQGVWIDSNNFVGTIRNVKFRYKKQRSAEQLSTLSKPTYAVQPLSGKRNLANGAQAVTNPTYWHSNSTAGGLTATRVNQGLEGDVPYVEYRIQGTATSSAYSAFYMFANSVVDAKVNDTFTARASIRMMSGSAAGVTGFRAEVTWVSETGVYISQAQGSLVPVSTSQQNAVTTGTLTDPSVPKARTALVMTVTIGATIDITVRIKGLQFERGAVATPLQLNYAPHYVIESGVRSLPHFYNDGGDSLVSFLEPGTHQYLVRETNGVVNSGSIVTDGLSQVNVLRGTRVRDIIVRKQPFTAAEMQLINEYWSKTNG